MSGHRLTVALRRGPGVLAAVCTLATIAPAAARAEILGTGGHLLAGPLPFLSATADGRSLVYGDQKIHDVGRRVVSDNSVKLLRGGRARVIARGPDGLGNTLIRITPSGKHLVYPSLHARETMLSRDMDSGRTRSFKGVALWGDVSDSGRYAIVRRGDAADSRGSLYLRDVGVLDLHTRRYRRFPRPTNGRRIFWSALNGTGSCALVAYAKQSGTVWKLFSLPAMRPLAAYPTPSTPGGYAAVSDDCSRVLVQSAHLAGGVFVDGRKPGRSYRAAAGKATGNNQMSATGEIVGFSCVTQDDPLTVSFFTFDVTSSTYTLVATHMYPSALLGSSGSLLSPDGSAWLVPITNARGNVVTMHRDPVSAGKKIGSQAPSDCRRAT